MLMTAKIYREYVKIRREEAHVFVDGVDVTSFCKEADTEKGTALCFIPEEMREGDSRRLLRYKRGGDFGYLMDLKRGKVEITFTALGEPGESGDPDQAEEEDEP